MLQQAAVLLERPDLQARHRLAEPARRARDPLGVAEVGRRLDYRARAKDRWVGGVLLQGPSCFRREGSRIVPP